MEVNIEINKNNESPQDENEISEVVCESGSKKLGQKEENKSYKRKQVDILKVFYILYAFTALTLITKFIVFFFCGNILISLDTSKLALALNAFIIFVGMAEGVRSFTTSATQSTGESTPVPNYKLNYLFGYMISFIIITIIAVTLEFITKMTYHDISEAIEMPDYCANEFLDGVVGNVISYLTARFGNKVAENIDLSSFKLFQKK